MDHQSTISVTSNASSRSHNSQTEGKDQIVPLYSERLVTVGGTGPLMRGYSGGAVMNRGNPLAAATSNNHNKSKSHHSHDSGDDETDDPFYHKRLGLVQPSSSTLPAMAPLSASSSTSLHQLGSTYHPHHQSRTPTTSHFSSSMSVSSAASEPPPRMFSPASLPRSGSGGSGGGGGGGPPTHSYWGTPAPSGRRSLMDDNDSYQQQQQSQQQPSSNSPTGIRNTLVFTARKRKTPSYLLIAAILLLGVLMYGRSHSSLSQAMERVTSLTEERYKVHEHFSKVEHDIRHLHRQILELDVVLGGMEEEETNSNSGGESGDGKESIMDEMTALQGRLDAGNSQIGSLQKLLQDVSKQDAILKYGAGRIRVELILDFPEDAAAAAASAQQHHPSKSNRHTRGDAAVAQKPHSLVMEMAPLSLMPHSVFMFLEMVDAELFDGCSFILNAMHVIKAAPLPYDGSSTTAKVNSFKNKGLDTVAFREYNKDYPHQKHTVGFAADGSPSFYINTQDNSDIHVGDPCFAQIVSGFDTVQRLEEAPTRNGIWYRQRIGIRSARIL